MGSCLKASIESIFSPERIRHGAQTIARPFIDILFESSCIATLNKNKVTIQRLEMTRNQMGSYLSSNKAQIGVHRHLRFNGLRQWIITKTTICVWDRDRSDLIAYWARWLMSLVNKSPFAFGKRCITSHSLEWMSVTFWRSDIKLTHLGLMFFKLRRQHLIKALYIQGKYSWKNWRNKLEEGTHFSLRYTIPKKVRFGSHWKEGPGFHCLDYPCDI